MNESLINNDAQDRKCPICKERIDNEAIVCRYCGARFDWRKHIQFSSTILALMVALISVVSWAIPFVYNSLKGENSDLHVFVAGVANDSLQLVVSNDGQRPGWFLGASITINYANSIEEWPLRIDEENRSERMILDGKSIQVSLIPLISPFENRHLQRAPEPFQGLRRERLESLSNVLMGKNQIEECKLSASFRNFDGSSVPFTVDLIAIESGNMHPLDAMASTDCFQFVLGMLNRWNANQRAANKRMQSDLQKAAPFVGA